MSLFVFWVETPEGVREIDEYAECYGEAFGIYRGRSVSSSRSPKRGAGDGFDDRDY